MADEVVFRVEIKDETGKDKPGFGPSGPYASSGSSSFDPTRIGPRPASSGRSSFDPSRVDPRYSETYASSTAAADSGRRAGASPPPIPRREPPPVPESHRKRKEYTGPSWKQALLDEATSSFRRGKYARAGARVSSAFSRAAAAASASRAGAGVASAASGAASGLAAIATAAVPLALAFGALAASAAIIKKAFDFVNEEATKAARFDPRVAAAAATGRVRQIEGEISRAQQYGKRYADFTYERDELAEDLREIKGHLANAIAPYVSNVLDRLNDLTDWAVKYLERRLDRNDIRPEMSMDGLIADFYKALDPEEFRRQMNNG